MTAEGAVQFFLRTCCAYDIGWPAARGVSRLSGCALQHGCIRVALMKLSMLPRSRLRQLSTGRCMHEVPSTETFIYRRSGARRKPWTAVTSSADVPYGGIKWVREAWIVCGLRRYPVSPRSCAVCGCARHVAACVQVGVNVGAAVSTGAGSSCVRTRAGPPAERVG
jgi:hypothetical protein